MALSENLQYIRARHGVTQEQLAEQLDVTRQSVSKWESAQSFPEMDTLLKLCDLYDTNLDTLLRGSLEQSQVSDTAQYDQFRSRFTWRVSLSVFGILMGVVLSLLCDAQGLPDEVCGAVLLLAVTVAVVVLVASGIQYDQFCKRYPTIADFYTQDQKDAFQRKFVWLISGGVGAILFGVVLLLLFLSRYEGQEPQETYVMCGFLTIVACAVLAFIYAGMQCDKYDVDKYNRENNPTPKQKARQNLIACLCGALMTLVTAAYVGLGLAQDQWESFWWLFPVGGILCGVVYIALDPSQIED